jgi:ABC-type amino acid transport substrate-binding protein
VAALRTGQIDATVMDFASGLRLEEPGTGRVFLMMRDYVPKMITGTRTRNRAAIASCYRG